MGRKRGGRCVQLKNDIELHYGKCRIQCAWSLRLQVINEMSAPAALIFTFYYKGFIISVIYVFATKSETTLKWCISYPCLHLQ